MLTDNINVVLASPLSGASREVESARHWVKVPALHPTNHKFWKRSGSDGDACGLCRCPKFAHVEPAASVEATVSGEAKT
jgi:hypothetical protein